MAQSNFRFISDASGGDQFTVVSFSGNEAISSLYQYEIELKAPLSAAIDLDDVLDSPASFYLDGREYPVYGVLSSIDELRTVLGYVYYRVVLVPRLWWLSLYKTNEIYTQEQTVDQIILNVLENGGFSSATDFDLAGLDDSRFLERDYVCQFGESDFDFISRLMENEGIFYYFDHSGGAEKIVFINDNVYDSILSPELIYDVTPSTTQNYDGIKAWSCRKQRLAEKVRIRGFDPYHPSVDISSEDIIDSMGQGTEYIYGENIRVKAGRNDTEESYLSGIRAEESRCQKTRYYGEGSVTRLQAGYVFGLTGHPNNDYNNVNYLTVEVTHEGRNLDMVLSPEPSELQSPYYHNSFTAIEASMQYRPARKTAKPRFYGTMTAFVHAPEGADPYIDEDGRYLVHLPFDHASGAASDDDALEDGDPRKKSAWIRMAQPYVGVDEGLYHPLRGGTEVLLTFINGDPDHPIISAALPNKVVPSLLTSNNSTESILQTKGPWIEQIGIDVETTLPLPDFSTLTIDKLYPEVMKNVCDEPSLHKNADAPMQGIHIDGHTNIQSKGSFVLHAQTQCKDAPLPCEDEPCPPLPPFPLTWSHNDNWGVTVEEGDPFNESMFATDSATYGDIFNNDKLTGVDLDLDEIKFEMLDDRVVLDTGGRDLWIKCNHYNVSNKSEVNSTVGHDHAVHRGTSYEYFEGDSEEHYKGIKKEFFDGKIKEETFKNTDLTATYGNADRTEDCTLTENFYGDKTETHYGNKNETHHGNLRSHHEGSVNETFHGASVSSFMGAKSENYFAGTNEFYLGTHTGITAALFFNLTTGIGIDKTTSLIKNSTTEIKNSLTEIKNNKLVKLGKAVADLENSEFRFLTLKMFIVG